MKTFVLLLGLICSLWATDTIRIVTEELPPFQIVDQGSVVGGLGYELVSELTQRVADSSSMEVLSWNRAYNLALKKPNVMIYSMVRSESREPKFKWVGKICDIEEYFWKRKDNTELSVNSIDDTKSYKIAVSKNDIQHQNLISQGFEENKNLYIVTDWNQAIKMLYLNRIDLVVAPEIMLAARVKTLNKDMAELEKVILQSKVGKGLYIAFSLNTSDDIVNRYKKAYAELIKDGTYDKILSKYVSSSTN